MKRSEETKKLPDGTDEQIVDYFLQNLTYIMTLDNRRGANSSGEQIDHRESKRDSSRALSLLVRYLSNDSRALKRFNPTRNMV